MKNQDAIVYLEGQWDCMCSEDCQIYTGHKDCQQGFICNDGQALQMAISALQEQDSRRICNTCKHNPPSKKWPCEDCDMRESADRWEPKEAKDSSLTQKGLDTISRQAAIDIFDDYNVSVENGELEAYSRDRKRLCDLQSAQPTLHGYNIEHLELIARVLQKEDLPPERIVEALTDIGRIVAIVKDEFEEALRKAVEQCTM